MYHMFLIHLTQILINGSHLTSTDLAQTFICLVADKRIKKKQKTSSHCSTVFEDVMAISPRFAMTIS